MASTLAQVAATSASVMERHVGWLLRYDEASPGYANTSSENAARNAR